MRYTATNGKVIDTDKMESIKDCSYDGQYGNVDSTLYRTPKTHNWYLVSESSWGGEGDISGAEAISLQTAAEMVLEDEDEDDIRTQYPELAPYIDQVIDL